jgi:ribonuclease Z
VVGARCPGIHHGLLAAAALFAATLPAAHAAGGAPDVRLERVQPASACSDERPLKVVLLGTGNPRPTMERFGPAILVDAGDHRVLVDAGRGASIRLMQAGGAAALIGLDVILFTHLHSDHVVGFPDLWLTSWVFGRARPTRVAGPPGTREMVGHVERAFAFDVRMRRDVDERLPADGVRLEAQDLEPAATIEAGPFRITAIDVDHRPVAPAYGYRIACGPRAVGISGDTRYSERLSEALRGVDVLIHEVVSPEVERRRALVPDPAAVQRIIEHHTTPEEAGRVFAAAEPRLAVYSHIVPSPATAADLVPPTRKTYTGPLEVGEDLMTITVGARVTVSRQTAGGAMVR